MGNIWTSPTAALGAADKAQAAVPEPVDAARGRVLVDEARQPEVWELVRVEMVADRQPEVEAQRAVMA